MTTFTQNSTDISPVIDINCKYFAAHLQVVHCDFERLKHSQHVLQNSKALTLIGACENLLSAAVELHQAMCAKDINIVDNQDNPKGFLSETPRQASNARQPIQQSAPKAGKYNLQGKSEVEFAFGDVVQLAKARLENQQKLKAEFADLKTKDWAQLLLIKSEKAYKGLQVEIDGQQITIKTLDDYCLHALGLSRRWVSENLDMLQEFGPDLFSALNSINSRFIDMRKVIKLSAEQKQALLQVAITGDKAATLAFIEQALQAGE